MRRMSTCTRIPSGSVNERFIPTAQMMDGNFSPSYLASLGPNFANGPFGNNAVAPWPSACTNGINVFRAA